LGTEGETEQSTLPKAVKECKWRRENLAYRGSFFVHLLFHEISEWKQLKINDCFAVLCRTISLRETILILSIEDI
jgi:hypothetical protein